MKTPILETERLILRPLKIADAEEIFTNWTSDPEVAKYMVYSTHPNVEVTKIWLADVESKTNSDTDYDWGFVRKSDGKLIGSGGIYYNAETGVYTMGYNIMKDCWHQGYTTEAATAMRDFGIVTLGAKRFRASHAKENIYSGKVMEKLGMHRVGEGEFTGMDGTKHYECWEYILEVEA